MYKRLLSLVLLLGMLTGLISSPAKAEVIVNKACSSGGTFEIVNKTVSGEKSNCLGAVVIPEGVTQVSEDAFGESAGITSVTIPASVTDIGEGAFKYSEIAELNVVAGNANYKSIDGVIFTKNGATLIIYPAAKSGAYTIPVGVTTIGNSAFEGTSAITAVTLSANVATFSQGAFSMATLTAINVVAGNAYYKSIDGVLFTKNGASLLKFPAARSGSYTISAGVSSIGEAAFSGATSLNSVTFDPGSQLTSIGNGAFEGTALVNVVIPSGVTTIGERAFAVGASLTSVTFASNSQLALIDALAFAGTSLTEFVIPASVTSIGQGAFNRVTSLTSVTFETGSNLATIGPNSFQLTGLSSIVIPASVTSVDAGAFDSAPLTSLTFEAGSKLTSIGDSAFKYTGLTNVVIPANVSSIGVDAFRQTPLDSLTFEAGSKLVILGDYAFFGQSKLTTISIPATVTQIGDYAFAYSPLLATVTFDAGSKLVAIGQGAFYGAAKLTAISIPASLTTLGRAAFQDAVTLAEVTFEPGSNLTKIENYVFRATSLTEITIPVGVTSFGPWAFSFASNLSSINFLGNAPTIGDGTFYQVPNSATAYVSSCATGFTASGNATWNGLILSVVQSANPCIAVYDLNGGSGTTSGALGLNGELAEAPIPPTRDGYTFVGWSTTNGGDLVRFPHNTGGSTNLTLFAKWLGNVNTVTYNSGGGTAVPETTFITGGQIVAAPTPPTRERHIFVRWDDERGESIVFPYTPSAVTNITLYAIWSYDENYTPTTPVVNPTTKPALKPTPTSKPKPNFVPKFSVGSSSLTKSGKTAIQKIVKTSGVDATYTITGAASQSLGVPTRFVKALAKARAEKVKAHLIKLGVKKSKIKIVIKITGSRVVPLTSIVSKSLTK